MSARVTGPTLAEQLAAAEPASTARRSRRSSSACATRAGCAGPCAMAGRAIRRRLRRIDVRGVTYDSRAVRPGALFVAVPGLHIGRARFAVAAIGRRRGASVHRRAARPRLAAAQLVVDATQPALATAAAWWYGDPSRELLTWSASPARTARRRRPSWPWPPSRPPASEPGCSGPSDAHRRRATSPTRSTHHARRRRPSSGPPGDGPGRRRGGRHRDDVARPGARPRRGGRLRRRHPDQPDP